MAEKQSGGRRIKRVFPILYGMAFVALIAGSLYNFTIDPPTAMFLRYPSPNDQFVAKFVLILFASILSLYIIVHYIYLEVFEHHGDYPPSETEQPLAKWQVIVEYGLRFLLAVAVALKLTGYYNFDDFIDFLVLFASITVIWHLFTRHFLRISPQSIPLMASYIVTFILSVTIAKIIHRDDFTLLSFLLLSGLCVTILTSTFDIIAKIGSSAWLGMANYFLDWD